MPKTAVKIDGFREEGTKLFFEYHCFESPNSADAELWYRSHSQVTVMDCDNAEEFGDLGRVERGDAGVPLVYNIKFEDGFVGAAFEDELLDSPKEYYRPNPPKR